MKIKQAAILFVVSFLFLFLINNTAKASDNNILIEIDLGFNIFMIQGSSEVSYKNKNYDIDKSTDADLNLDLAPGFLLLAGYEQPRYAVGGEIGTFKYSGEFDKDIKFKSDGDGGYYDGGDYDYYGNEFEPLALDGGTTFKKDKSKFDLNIFHIGPFGRYYFKIANEKIRPFIGGALGYNMCSIKHNKGDKMDYTAVNVSAFGGSLFQVHKNILLGVSGRLDYYYPISEAEDSDFMSNNDKWSENITMFPFSVLGNVAFVF